MQESWAEELCLGRLTIRQVPIRKGDPAVEAMLGHDYEATLGLYALGRLAMVVDAKRHKIYLKTDAAAPPAMDYNYNRLGAVFVPKDPNSNDLVAHVVQGSPAYDAGIRNDDILLRVNEMDATKWRTDPRVLRTACRGPLMDASRHHQGSRNPWIRRARGDSGVRCRRAIPAQPAEEAWRVQQNGA